MSPEENNLGGGGAASVAGLQWPQNPSAVNFKMEFIFALSSFLYLYGRPLMALYSVKQAVRAGIFKQSMGSRNRVGIGLSYRPARLHRLAEFVPWN